MKTFTLEKALLSQFCNIKKIRLYLRRYNIQYHYKYSKMMLKGFSNLIQIKMIDSHVS